MGRPTAATLAAREYAARRISEVVSNIRDLAESQAGYDTVLAELLANGTPRDTARQAAAWAIRRARGVAIRAGTAPNASLCLTDDERAWLVEQGGIQPTIKRLIAEARK